MNAYEYPVLRAKIDMLENINKQQADRIAELEKQLETQGKLLRAYAEELNK